MLRQKTWSSAEEIAIVAKNVELGSWRLPFVPRLSKWKGFREIQRQGDEGTS